MKSLIPLFLISSILCLSDHAPYMIPSSRPLILSHRGDCGQFPEHSYASYSSAHYAGTDFNELDLGVTKDLKLVVFHNPTLKEVTNIEDHPEFESRKTPYFTTPHCKDEFHDDFVINNFTLDEIYTLRARNRLHS